MRNLQEKFWAGEFGDHYSDRNNELRLVIPNIALFTKILRRMGRVQSICELGANVGLNLIALHTLLPDAELTAVEINQKAVKELENLKYVKVKCGSIYEGPLKKMQYDLVFSKGVLIHQDPTMLNDMYQILYQSSKRYILICEYYNPTPIEVEYRGNKSVLFKRDFAGELMEQYSDLELLDYGFIYHRDCHFPGDDFTWFLLEKKK